MSRPSPFEDCYYCGRSAHEPVVSDVRGRGFAAILCEICIDLYGSGSRHNNARGVAPTTEEVRRIEAGRALRLELVALNLRGALSAAEVDDEERLVRLYGCCQWCGVMNGETREHERADEQPDANAPSEPQRASARSDELYLHWLIDGALVPAGDSRRAALVVLRMLAHPDSEVDASPGEGVGARHMLRLLCTVCTALSAEAGKDASEARGAELLAAFEDRLRHPQYRGRGED